MTKLRELYGLVPAFALTSALAGCATFGERGMGGTPADAKVTENVQTLFDEHPEFGAPDSLHVQTLDHVVYLSGLTASGLEKEEAESVALQAPGAARVVNSIEVTH